MPSPSWPTTPSSTSAWARPRGSAQPGSARPPSRRQCSMSSQARHVSIIGTVGLPARYGGFETLVEQLVRRLNARFEFTVYCSARSYQERPSRYAGATLVYLPLKANGPSSVAYDV